MLRRYSYIDQYSYDPCPLLGVASGTQMPNFGLSSLWNLSHVEITLLEKIMP